MTFDKVREILSNQLDINPEEITENTNIGDDLGADSLDIVEMMMAIEETFGIEIADEDAKEFKTIADVVAYIDARA